MTFGERLKEARTDRKLSQATLGSRVGVSYVTINHYEQNKTAPSIDKLVAIANALGVTLDWLCGKEDGSIKIVYNNNWILDLLISHDSDLADITFKGPKMLLTWKNEKLKDAICQCQAALSDINKLYKNVTGVEPLLEELRERAITQFKAVLEEVSVNK
jgi:transcriptional regulator with XRE-family HTH domain